jgi:glycosyltransferase involved in cell wall biosynthesis
LRPRIEKLPVLLRLIARSEFHRVRKFESNLPSYPYCFAYSVVGDKDAEYLSLFRPSPTKFTPNIVCHSIGVDIPVSEQPSGHISHHPPFDILFFGSLYYYPNIEAISWFLQEVCPRLNKTLSFNIIIAGAKPSRYLIDLCRKFPSVTLISNPRNMSPLIASSSITVAPLRSGSGQQFKVIESLALATPVVTTSLAAMPLGLEHNVHILVADSPSEFAHSIELLISDQALYSRLAAAGYSHVVNKFSWFSKSLLLEQMYLDAISELNK